MEEEYIKLFIHVIKIGYIKCVKTLLEDEIININCIDNEGNTPLYVAAQNSNTDCVHLLLADARTDVNKAHNDGATPLFIAAEKGHTDCVKLFLADTRTDVNKNVASIICNRN